MDIPQSLTACSWKTMVGRLLCYWGWLIFRGYVKLPDSREYPPKWWALEKVTLALTAPSNPPSWIFWCHLNPFQYGDDNVKQGEADQAPWHGDAAGARLLKCDGLMHMAASLSRPIYAAGGKPKSRAPFKSQNHWPTYIIRTLDRIWPTAFFWTW